MLTLAIIMLAAWTVGAALLWWPQLTGASRRKLALLSSAAGLVAMMLAMSTEGFRESPTVAVFVLGTTYVTEKASASASLPYYVLTGVFLSLGFFGLALGDEEARALGRRWLLTALALSWLVTAIRFLLEKVAAPPFWTQAVGVTWLAPVVGAFFALNLRAEGRGFRSLLAALVVYAYGVRLVVAGLMTVATRMRLGSHYDVSALVLVYSPLTGYPYTFQEGSAAQILGVVFIPQLLIWPIYTVVAGLLGAGAAWIVLAAGGLKPLSPAPIQVAPAGQD
jgi:hypothetical protein